MSKVYVIIEDFYSGYITRGVYSSKEKALEASKLFGIDTENIQEWELDAKPETINGMFRYDVSLNDSGDAYWRLVDVEDKEAIREWCPCYTNEFDKSDITIYVWAHGEEQAISAARKRFSELKASGEWPVTMAEWKAKQGRVP